MPELPEVEAARRAVHESCSGRHIVEAVVADDSLVIDGVSPSALQSALVGRTIMAAHRKGKNLWLELDSRPWPSFQFGMTGAFNIKGKEITKYKRSAVSDEEDWPSKFSKVFFKLDDGLEVSFTDKRRLARVRLLNDPATALPISELGPDAYLELPAEDIFTHSISKKKGPIKALLLDQSFLAGIGNWVADEVLYQARIHPEQVACSLLEAECLELHKTIQKVLKLSVDVDADSERFPKEWIFHYRWNKKPGEVSGQKISFITVGGRTSAIVSTLQKCTTSSARKQKVSAEKEVEDKALENGTGEGKKKRGRKGQSTGILEEESLEANQSQKKSKRSTKQSPQGEQVHVKKAGKGNKSATKLKGSEETKLAVKSQKEEEAADVRKSVRQNGKDKLSIKKKRVSEEAVTSTVTIVQKEKVSIKASTKKATKTTTRETTNSNSREELGVVEREVSDITKKKQSGKRNRVSK